MKKHQDKSKSSSTVVEEEKVDSTESKVLEEDELVICPLPEEFATKPVETKEEKKAAFTKVTSLPSDSPSKESKSSKSEDKEEVVEEKKDSKKSKSKTPIWDSLKDLEFSLFSLPNKPVSYHVGFVSETPLSCFGSFVVPAVIPALETNFGKQFNFNVIDKKTVEITKK